MATQAERDKIIADAIAGALGEPLSSAIVWIVGDLSDALHWKQWGSRTRQAFEDLMLAKTPDATERAIVEAALRARVKAVDVPIDLQATVLDAIGESVAAIASAPRGGNGRP